MSIQGGPYTTTDGLVLSLDAGNPKSYPGSGTTWYYLSGNNNGTLTNGPTFNSSNGGNIVFDGSNDTVDITLDLRKNFSYECWCYHSVVSGFCFLGQGVTSYNNGLHIWYSGANNLRFGMYSNDTDVVSLTTAANTWYQYVFTYNHSTYVKNIFRNGLQLTGTAQQTQSQYTGTGTVRIGATYSSSGAYANGRFAIAKIYSNVLNSNEILQNYNATKTRFDL